MASLGHLQWLNVSANRLEWFDYAFIPHSLEWLDISHNDIGELGNFYHLQNFNLHTLEEPGVIRKFKEGYRGTS